MNNLRSKATKILSKVKICSWCLGRQFTTRLNEAQTLGEALGSTDLVDCEFCGGAYGERMKTIQDMVNALRPYEFKSVQIGVIMSKDNIDKEDEIRAKFKLNSGVGIKKALVSIYRSELHNQFPQISQNNAPDIIVKVDYQGKQIHVESKSASYFVRYVKLERGIQTRGKTCGLCVGVGCKDCFDTGLENRPLSVEFFIVKQFKQSFEASKVKISWSGTDDEESIVDGSGRPVFVQVSNPKYRYSGINRLDRMVGEPIQLIQVEQREFDPSTIMGLKKTVRYSIKTSRPWTPNYSVVESTYKNRIIPSASKGLKKVYWLKILSVKDFEVVALAFMDNGISPWNLLKFKYPTQKDQLGLVDIIGEDKITTYTYDVMDFRQD